MATTAKEHHIVEVTTVKEHQIDLATIIEGYLYTKQKTLDLFRMNQNRYLSYLVDKNQGSCSKCSKVGNTNKFIKCLDLLAISC